MYINGSNIILVCFVDCSVGTQQGVDAELRECELGCGGEVVTTVELVYRQHEGGLSASSRVALHCKHDPQCQVS